MANPIKRNREPEDLRRLFDVEMSAWSFEHGDREGEKLFSELCNEFGTTIVCDNETFVWEEVKKRISKLAMEKLWTRRRVIMEIFEGATSDSAIFFLKTGISAESKYDDECDNEINTL